MSDSEAPVALVTGAAKRVGRAVALRLADEGLDVAFTYRTSEREAGATREGIEARGRAALPIRVDLGELDAIDAVERAFRERFARLDALVNNASIFGPSAWGGISGTTFDRYMAVNARAPLFLIQRFAADLAAGADPARPETLGRVVNFIDIHVLGEPLPGYLAYNCSKAALAEITQTCARELAPHVTVNAIAPGVVAWAPDYTEQMKRDYMERVPLGRPGTPEDAAAAVRYLVREAHYCTGQTIRLDGGRFIS